MNTPKKRIVEEPVIKWDRNGLFRCRVCGCTEVDACQPPCAWAETGLCTTCADAIADIQIWQGRARRANMTALLRELKSWTNRRTSGRGAR